MDHSSWYGGQAYPYHLHEPPIAADPHAHNAALPPQPPPPQYQQLPSEPSYPLLPSSSTLAAAAAVPTTSQYPYQPYDYPPNPSGSGAPVPATSDFYDPPPSAGSAVPQPPGVEKPYSPYTGRNGHAALYGYPTVGAASFYHGLAGAVEHRGFSAKEAIRQYGVDPVAYGNVLGPPYFFMHDYRATHPHYGTARKKEKKVAKVVQSAYCAVCDINCNTQEVLANHKQGKKHKKNLEKLKEAVVPMPAKAPTTAAEIKEASKVEKDKDKAASDQTKRKSAPVTEVDLETKKRRLLEEGATEDSMRVCTACNIVCNSEVVFNSHIAGQKHATMVKKQAASAG